MTCFLCQDKLVAGLDVQTTFTSKSEMTLLSLLEEVAGNKFLPNSYLICTTCCHFLNELDVIKLRVKELEEKFKKYIDRSVNDKTEECPECHTEIPHKAYEEHLKTHCPDSNDSTVDLDNDDSDGEQIIANEKSTTILEKPKSDILKPHKCPQCPKTWKTANELKNHLLSHTGDKPYICEICGQAYKRQQALKIHVGMHNGISPFTCAHCNKSFTQKGALVRHTRIHTGDPPFQCDLCGKRFMHHSSFKMHKLSHTGQKSHKCNICGLLLMCRSHLRRHIKGHTGEKKFSCNVCGKKFAEKYNLGVHEKLHQGVSKKKKYQCQICDNVYSGQVKWEEHLRNVHQKVQFPIELE